ATRWFRELQRAPGRLEVDGPSAPLAQHLAGACSALSPAVAWELLSSWVLAEASALEGVPALARIRALEVLTPQLAARPSLRAASEALLGDHDPRLSRAAVQALVQVGDEPARRALSAYYPRTASPRERRAIEGLFPAGE
ncbi:MAG: HEAT repeat domain-containing protein, partial [Planctomycetota bacterium]|nr:HEAT repeat domain-containing protein [Planctomycetota bacterium]